MPVARARLACHHQRSGIPVRCTGPGAHALSFALVTGDQLVTGIVNEHLRAKTALECPFDGWPAGLLRWLEIHQDLKCLALRGEKDLDPCLFHRPGVEACHQLNLGRCPVDLLLCGFVVPWRSASVAMVLSWPVLELGSGPGAPCMADWAGARAFVARASSVLA